jgi:hypothetical protein
MMTTKNIFQFQGLECIKNLHIPHKHLLPEAYTKGLTFIVW